MQAESLGMNLEISKVVNENVNSIDPMVIDILENLTSDISTVQEHARDYDSKDVEQFLNQALEDVENSMHLSERDNKAVKFL